MKHPILLGILSLIGGTLLNAQQEIRSARIEQVPVIPTPIMITIPMPENQNQNQNNNNMMQQAIKDQTDQIMFSNFLSVLGNFGKIFLNPKDITSAKMYAAGIIDGLVNIAQAAMRKPNQNVTINLAMQELLIAAILRYAYMRKMELEAEGSYQGA